MSIYSIGGRVLTPTTDETNAQNFQLDYGRNTQTGTNYIIARIYQKKVDGALQYPFVYAPFGTGSANKSVLEMNAQCRFPIAVNAGVFDVNTNKAMGTIIENSMLIQQGESMAGTSLDKLRRVITINRAGELGWAEPETDGNQMIASGIVSACLSFVPILIDYDDAGKVMDNPYLDHTGDAQRQVIGQFGNGDYCIITAEGRGFQNSVGFKMREVQQLCMELGLKFAFNLDGGGSAQTVVGQKHINTIYERGVGRIVPTYIVFNGTTTFGEPV